MKKEDLKKIYQIVCDEYAQTLCDMYEWEFKDCFWVSDDVGGTFCTDDIEFSLSMSDIRLLVDNDVDYGTFVEWWDHNMEICHSINLYNEKEENDNETINLYSWLKEYRGNKNKKQDNG